MFACFNIKGGKEKEGRKRKGKGRKKEKRKRKEERGYNILSMWTIRFEIGICLF